MLSGSQAYPNDHHPPPRRDPGGRWNLYLAIAGLGLEAATQRGRKLRIPLWTAHREEEQKMKINGQCHCGEISFEAEVDAALFGICHCTDCQTLTGSAFNASVPVPTAKFVLVGGNPKIYVKTAADGRKSHSMFCGNCGSRVYSYSESDPALYRIRLGVIAQRATFSARGQIWRRSALPWVDTIASIPAHDRQPS